MRRRLDSENDLLRALGVKLDEWNRDLVGTIHAFQGREADVANISVAMHCAATLISPYLSTIRATLSLP